MRDSIQSYFPSQIQFLLKNLIPDDFFSNIQEIRLRSNQPIIITNQNKNFTLTQNSLTQNISSGVIISPKILIKLSS